MRGMGTPSPPADPFLADLDAQVAALAARARRLTEPLTSAQMSQAPAKGGWSVAEVLEHVIALGDEYLVSIREQTASAAKTATPGRWSPSLWGRIMAWSMAPTNTLKLPTLERFRGPVPRSNVTADFQRHLCELSGAIREADGKPLTKTRFVSPLNAAIRMNLGDGLRLMVLHTDRHLGQVERVRAELGV